MKKLILTLVLAMSLVSCSTESDDRIVQYSNEVPSTQTNNQQNNTPVTRILTASSNIPNSLLIMKKNGVYNLLDGNHLEVRNGDIVEVYNTNTNNNTTYYNCYLRFYSPQGAKTVASANGYRIYIRYVVNF